jgi:ubiquinone/menaquinone biosynthesis C-methylase UbiE
VSGTVDRYERIAPFYDFLDWPFEHGRYRHIRPLLFEGLRGRILDAGVGTGRNIPFYPAGAEVVGIDQSPAMLARAERRRASLGGKVELRRLDVTQLDFADASFDAAVATFLFCVLPNELQTPALREIAPAQGGSAEGARRPRMVACHFAEELELTGAVVASQAALAAVDVQPSELL